MILNVHPCQKLRGRLNLPASKSYSIRAFIIASLGGISKIISPSNCDDALVAKKTAESLGAIVREISPNVWDVRADSRRENIKKIDVRESGTVLRMVIPLIPQIAHKAIIVGSGTLNGRPNQFLLDTLNDHGAHFKGRGDVGSIPIYYLGGGLRPGRYTINGSISSQFISALLIALPMLKEKSSLQITGKDVVSEDYIHMTLRLLSKSGIRVTRRNSRHFLIPGNQKFKGLGAFHVPSDYGLAAYFLAASCLLDSKLILQGTFPKNLIQADERIIPLMRAMGARIKTTPKTLNVLPGLQLKGGVFSLKDCPDLVPIMTVLALFAQGRTRLTHIGHARVKESNRISDLRSELLKIGARIEEKMDEMIIYPSKNYRCGASLDPHHDHRLAMAFSILGLKLGVRVKDIECTRKSYPDFRRDLQSIIVPS